jgi:hypothetical protein
MRLTAAAVLAVAKPSGQRLVLQCAVQASDASRSSWEVFCCLPWPGRRSHALQCMLRCGPCTLVWLILSLVLSTPSMH